MRNEALNSKVIEELQKRLTEAYTQDNMRKMTFNKEIFPLILRFENGKRSAELYDAVLIAEQMLMIDINR
jgi:hypothetical protein